MMKLGEEDHRGGVPRHHIRAESLMVTVLLQLTIQCTFYYKQEGPSHSFNTCLEISSAQQPILTMCYSCLHKTQEHSQVLRAFIRKISFSLFSITCSSFPPEPCAPADGRQLAVSWNIPANSRACLSVQVPFPYLEHELGRHPFLFHKHYTFSIKPATPSPAGSVAPPSVLSQHLPPGILSIHWSDLVCI